MEMKCLFCDYSGEVRKDHMIYEDSTYVAFLSKRALSPGHALLIPKSHITDIEKLDAGILHAAKKLTDAILKATDADVLNIQISCGKAMERLPHIHVHLIPVFRTDMGEISDTQKAGLARRIRDAYESAQ